MTTANTSPQPAPLVWSGVLDIDSVDAAAADVDLYLATQSASRQLAAPMVIDLSGVTFVDSTAMALFVYARNACTAAGVDVVLRDAPVRVRRLFTVTGLAEVFSWDDAEPTGAPPTDSFPEHTMLPARADTRFDELAALVSRLLHVPSALLTLIDRDGLVFPGMAGLTDQLQGQRAAGIQGSFCQYVVSRAAPLVIPDTAANPLFASGVEQQVSAYAGMPVTDHTGRAIGTLCAIDSAPREWTDVELANLADLAKLCSRQLQWAAAGTRADDANERERVMHTANVTALAELDETRALLVRALNATGGVEERQARAVLERLDHLRGILNPDAQPHQDGPRS